MTQTTKEEIQKTLSSLSPGQQSFAKAIAMDRIELVQLRDKHAKLDTEYQTLFQFLIVMLMTVEDRKLTLHRSQFSKFKDSYRVIRYWDEEGEHLTFELKTLADDMEPSGDETVQNVLDS